MLRFFAVCVVGLLGLVHADEHIALAPPTMTPNVPHKMMVFIPGGNVPNDKYTATAKAIQAAVSPKANLWVVIPAVFKRLCIISCTATAICSPLHSDVEAALKQAQGMGWNRTNDKEDIYLAGHSLGGVCANTLMQAYSMPYAALIVFGSYVDETGSFSLSDYPTPVLTLNVELDGGLARPGKTSIWWRQFLALNKSSATAIRDKPVIILPQLNHSDFCPGFDVPGDLPAEVSQVEATATIGNMVAAYLSVQMNKDSPSAEDMRALHGAVEWTRGLMTPYVTAEDMTVDRTDTSMGEGSSKFCAMAQHLMVGMSPSDDAKMFTRDGFHVSSPNLEHCHPNYTLADGKLMVNTCSHTDYYIDIANTGSIEASKQVACKMISFDRIAEQLKVPTKDNDCSVVNAKSVEIATALAAPATLNRFKAKGRSFCYEADSKSAIGPTWVFVDGLGLKENSTCLSVQSPKLESLLDSKIYPGNVYCKFLSPERVLDYMMTDGLKPLS